MGYFSEVHFEGNLGTITNITPNVDLHRSQATPVLLTKAF